GRSPGSALPWESPLFIGLRELLLVLRFVDLFQNSRLAEQAAHRVRRLCARRQPLEGFFLVDLDLSRIRERIVISDLLDQPAIPVRAGIRHPLPVEGLFLGFHALQADSNGNLLSPPAQSPGISGKEREIPLFSTF